MSLRYAAVRIGEPLSLGSSDGKALDITSSADHAANLVDLSDEDGHVGHVLAIEHEASSGASYGIDISNMPGARAGLVVHQYSAAQPAVILDNTDSEPLVRMNNTVNETRNPGGVGTGEFVLVQDSNVDLAAWQGNGDIEWLDNSIGPVLLDRTNGSRYRLYMDGGTLSTEVVS